MFSLPMNLERSLKIEASPEQVFPLLVNFDNWAKWSPWLMMEPECKPVVSGVPGKVGHKQTWSGNLIGSGETTITSIALNQRIDFDLVFLKPWKSQSKTWFQLAPEGTGTLVTWSMQGTLPIFIFFLRRLLIGLIGSDYMRGLKMLQDLAEGRGKLTQIHWKGVEQKPAFVFLGVERSCHITEISKTAADDLKSAQNLISKTSSQISGKPRMFCPKFDFATGECVYVAGMEVASLPTSLPDGLKSLNIPPHKALVVEHKGPYKHIGNAWSLAMMKQREGKHKIRKDISGYETYFSMPGNVQDSEILTTVSIPIKE